MMKLPLAMSIRSQFSITVFNMYVRSRAHISQDNKPHSINIFLHCVRTILVQKEEEEEEEEGTSACML